METCDHCGGWLYSWERSHECPPLFKVIDPTDFTLYEDPDWTLIRAISAGAAAEEFCKRSEENRGEYIQGEIGNLLVKDLDGNLWDVEVRAWTEPQYHASTPVLRSHAAFSSPLQLEEL